MPSNIIQWFPGHMAKTRRLISECLPLVDVVIEILDARIPLSSQNPEIDRLCQGKPRLVILSKSLLANPDATALWKKHFQTRGGCIPADFITGAGINEVEPEIRKLCSAVIEKYDVKGMSGKSLRAMVVGIPNVGKSSFINKISKTKKAKVEDRPGVTLEKQWVKTQSQLELLDMPGVLWPKFDDVTVAENLAMTGAIKDQILDTEHLAVKLCSRLRSVACDDLCKRYKLSQDEITDLENWEIFELIGRKRGLLISGGEINYERCAKMLLDEFRGAVIGRITLEIPKK